MAAVGDEVAVAPVDAKPGELLADTDKDLVGSSVMISYSRKGKRKGEDSNAVAGEEKETGECMTFIWTAAAPPTPCCDIRTRGSTCSVN